MSRDVRDEIDIKLQPNGVRFFYGAGGADFSFTLGFEEALLIGKMMELAGYMGLKDGAKLFAHHGWLEAEAKALLMDPERPVKYELVKVLGVER